MNQETLLRFLLEHGPITDQRETRANAIKKSWEKAQLLLDEHPEYKATEAAWGFHVKNMEELGDIVIRRPSPRISTMINVAPIRRGAPGPEPVVVEPTQLAEVVQMPPAPPAPAPKPAVRAVTNTDPVVGIKLELPAGRAAQILAELSELPPPAVLEPSQLAVLIDGYREMTERLSNFVSETFAVWMEMTEKIDRIEAALSGSLEPITTEPIDISPPEAVAAPERKDRPVKPKLSAVPRSVSDKDLRNLYGTLAAHGYTVEPSNGGHIKLTPPSGTNGAQVLFGPTSPSDHRSIKNLRAQIKREGIEVP